MRGECISSRRTSRPELYKLRSLPGGIRKLGLGALGRRPLAGPATKWLTRSRLLVDRLGRVDLAMTNSGKLEEYVVIRKLNWKDE